jgi:KDO2-lipid IV(A) lauroyltransferase
VFGARLSIAAFLGTVLGFFVGRVLRVRRVHVLASLRRAEIAAPDRVADGMYASLGRGVFELLAMAVRPGCRLAERVEVGHELRELVTQRRGVVLATAHTGNWDLVACAVAEQLPLTVITKHLSVAWLDRFWQRMRARRGVQLISEGGAARAAQQALARGGAVAMLIDQAPERTRARTTLPFLAQLADIDLAPALIALRARAPLALVVAERLPGKRHRARVLALFEPPARPSRAWAEETMQSATRALEAHVRELPEQWLWMHRRWKRAAAAPRSALTAQRAQANPAAGETPFV